MENNVVAINVKYIKSEMSIELLELIKNKKLEQKKNKKHTLLLYNTLLLSLIYCAQNVHCIDKFKLIKAY